LFEEMKANDRVDVISYNTLLKGLTASGRWAEAESLLQEMRARGLKPNQVTYNSLINAAVANGDMNAAWRFLEDMEAQGVSVDNFTCSIMMKGIKHSSRRDDIDRTLSLIEKANVTPDEVLVNTLLDACVRLRDVRRLTNALAQFKASGVVPSLHTYGTLIKAYGHAKRLDQSWALWHELIHERKLDPNEVTYGCMLDACVSNGAIDDAMRLFQELKMKIPDFSRNTVVYSTLIKGFAQRKEMQRAVQLYNEMVSDGVTCNLVTFNTLIDACSRVGDMERAASLFSDMCEQGVTPDLITYSTIIKGYCVNGDLEQAIQLFTMMRKRGIVPDAILFNSILDGCAKKQMRTLTEQVLNDMETADIAPSNFTLSILVKLYGRCRDLDTAFDRVDFLPRKHGFEVNAHVYTCLMSACISNGQLPRALEVFRTMEARRCMPDSKTYTTIINGCLKSGDMENAVKLVDSAFGLDGRVGPVIPLDSELIQNVLFMIGRRRLTQQLGMPLMERLKRAGVEVSQRVYTSVLRGAMQQENNSSAQPSRFHNRRVQRQQEAMA